MKSTVLAVVLALWAPSVAAQSYPVRDYTEDDGLPSPQVEDVSQDASGHLWFATRGGVAVFDGRTWTRHDEDSGLTPRSRIRVAFDERDTPWALSRTPRADLSRWIDGRWTSMDLPRLPDGCPTEALAVIRGADPVRLAIGTRCGLLIHEADRWRRIADAPLPSSKVIDLLWHDERLFVATSNGLAVFAGEPLRQVPAPQAMPGDLVTGLAADTCDGRPCVWIVGENWVGKIQADVFRIAAEFEPKIDATIRSRPAVADGNGGIVFGAPYALHHFHPITGLQSIDRPDGTPVTGANALLFDREGNTWLASTKGASKISSLAWATYRSHHGLLDDEVTATLELEDGSILLGHLDGLTRITGDTVQTIPFEAVPGQEFGRGRVLDLALADDGTVWIASGRRGLGRLRNGTIDWSGLSPGVGVMSVRVDEDDRLWVAEGRELLVDRGRGLERVEIDPERRLQTRRLQLDRQGRLYACTIGSGLFRLDENGWQAFRSSDNPGHDDVFSVHQLEDGTVWAGTMMGLVELNDDELVAVESPRINRPVYSMLQDNLGRIWFGTDNGILRWDGHHLKSFSVEAGLAGRETNRAASLLDSQGNVWIGTTSGVTRFSPDLEHRSTAAPLVSIAGLDVSGEPVALGDAMEWPYDRNDLLFRFDVVTFAHERSVRVQSRLIGFEVEWSPLESAERVVRYTNLAPGNYRFEVRAANGFDSWSPPVASPSIVIRKPFWGLTRFWVLVGMCMVGIGYLISRWFYQVRYSRRLQSEVRQRVEELRSVERELNQARQLKSLGLLAGGIAHDFNNLLTVVMGNLSMIADRVAAPNRPFVDSAASAIRRASELTGQLLTFSRGGAPVRNPERIDQVIRDSAAFVLSGSNVRCEFDLPNDLRVADIDAGQISQVLNNLLINATQAMPDGGTIHIGGRNVDSLPGSAEPGPYVAISVRDEGTGIYRDDLPRIFEPYFSTKDSGSGIGLSTAYSIILRHEGRLTVDSRPGEGTTFTFIVPAAREDAQPSPQVHEERRFDGIRALVMDDDEDVRVVLQQMLENLGCRVVSTRDGREALERHADAVARNEPFDVFVLDVTIPGGMGGEETMRRILLRTPGARGIVISGYANSAVMSEHRDHGFLGMLRKPFDSHEVTDVLQRVLERSPTH